VYFIAAEIVIFFADIVSQLTFASFCKVIIIFYFTRADSLTEEHIFLRWWCFNSDERRANPMQ